MTSFAQQLVSVEREHLDLRAGVLGLVVLAVFGAAVALVGPVAMAAAIGALVLLATDPPPPGRSWAMALLPLVVGGAVLTFVAVAIGGQAVPGALLVGVVCVVATLHGGRSRKAGVRGLVVLALADEAPEHLHGEREAVPAAVPGQAGPADHLTAGWGASTSGSALAADRRVDRSGDGRLSLSPSTAKHPARRSIAFGGRKHPAVRAL